MPLRLPARQRWVIAGLAAATVTALGCYAAVANASPSADAAAASNPTSTPTSAPTSTTATAAAPAAATPAATSSAAPAALPSAGSLTPADILDVTFDSGAPVDHAQGLAATTIGAPQIANDATIGADVATFNGSSDAYLFPFQSQWPKMESGFSYECIFKYNATSYSSGQQAVCSDTSGGGADLLIQNGQLAFYLGTYQGGSAYDVAQDPNTLIPGQWYIATASWDGTTNSLYVDGYLAAQTPAAPPLTLPGGAGAQNFLTGADANTVNGGELFSPVSIAEARVFSHGLTAAEAQTDAQAYGLYAPPPPPPSITAANVTTTAEHRTTTFTATLSDQAMTGLVSFQYHGIDILCQAVVSNGSATCTARKLPPPGRYDVEVRYSGDLYYSPMSTDLTLTVHPGNSLTGR